MYMWIASVPPHLQMLHHQDSLLWNYTRAMCMFHIQWKIQTFLAIKAETKNLYHVGSKGLTTVTIKNTIICDVTLCGLAEVYQYFRGTAFILRIKKYLQ
jgi:hypothetical protein